MFFLSAHPVVESSKRRLALVLTLGLAAAGFVLCPHAVRAQGASLTTLHSFNGTDGNNPNYDARLIQARDGNFYGTTANGGAGGYGTVFKTTAVGTLTTLYSFNGGTDGRQPLGGLIQGTDGNFYGTTNAGGSGGEGTVFQLTPAGALTTLHSFAGGNDGANPQAGLLQAADGNFYGTTYSGGTGSRGTIYQVTPAGTLTILFAFGGANGEELGGRLVQTGDGNFYGTTYNVSGSAYGTVFRFSPTGTLTTLYQFSNSDGAYPEDGLIVGGDGNLYGTTESGGSGGGGTVFRLNPNTGTLSTIHTFTSSEGGGLDGALLQASDGNFYGTIGRGGSGSNGTIFRLTPDGTATVVYAFSGGSDGRNPYPGLVEGTDSRLYGVTQYGGINGDGTVYQLNASGTIEFAAAAASVNEAAGTLALTVSRVGGSIGAASIAYATADGTGVAGKDYAATSGTFTWANGDATDRTITVPITDEQLYNGDLTFTVGLSQPGGAATLGIPSQTTVTINDNDNPPQPTLTLTNPPDGLTLAQGASLPLTADVSDPGGILDHVEFYAGTEYLGSVYAPGPYVLNVNAPDAGTYSISAAAIDNQDRKSVSETHALVVVPYNASYTAPSVSILTDVNNRSLAAGSTLDLSVSAFNGDGSALQRVSFYADGVLFASFDGAGNVLTNTYPGMPAAPARRADAAGGVSTVFAAGLQLPGSNKLVNVVAVALSQLGTSQISSPVSVQAVATADQPPQVAFSGASTASVHTNTPVTVPLTITNPATGGADGAVTRVEYYVNNQKVKDSAAAPYTLGFTPTQPGAYVLTAIATDSAGLAGVSAPVTIHAVEIPDVGVAALGGGYVAAGGKAKVRFTRTGGDDSGALTVRYKTAGTAVKGTDYQPPAGTVTIPAGAASAKVKIKALAGAGAGGTRQVLIKLLPSADGSYNPGTPAKAKVTILGQ